VQESLASVNWANETSRNNEQIGDPCAPEFRFSLFSFSVNHCYRVNEAAGKYLLDAMMNSKVLMVEDETVETFFRTRAVSFCTWSYRFFGTKIKF
jgi:hypothetical protein